MASRRNVVGGAFFKLNVIQQKYLDGFDLFLVDD